MLNYIVVAICLVMLGMVQSQTCQYLNQTDEARLYNPCVYVVDYEFYLPATKSAEQLREIASTKLNNSLLLELPTTCTASLVRYACSLIYYKCLPQYVATGAKSEAIYKNDTTLPFSVYLPIERPCVSVCTDVQTYCSVSPIYKATQSYPNCFAKYNFASLPSSYAQPYQFDLRNNASACYVSNLITNSFITETYVRNGSYSPCAGIVDTFVNPPGTKINSEYTMLQLSYTYQDTVNSALMQVADNLPVWLSKDCRLATMAYFCYRFFFKPEAITFGQALTQSLTSLGLSALQPTVSAGAAALYSGILTSTLYFPSYANRSFCSNYGESCASFLAIANKSALKPNCTLESSDSFIFPDGKNQTAYTLSLTVGERTIPISFVTQPNYFGYHNKSEYTAYEPTCPNYYVIPEHPDGKEVNQVSGSACAVGCQSAIWTADEWNGFGNIARSSSAVSLAFGLVLLIFIVVMQDWKQSYLIFMFTIFAVICSGSLFHLHNGTTFEERFCYDNAQAFSQKTDATSPCVQTAIITTYCFLCGMTTMFVLSVHRVLSLRGDKNYIINHLAYIPVQMAFLFLPPIIPVVYGAANKCFGYSGIQPWCFFRSYPNVTQNKDVFWLGWPVLVVAFFTFSLLIISEIIFIVQRCRGPVYKIVVQDESALSPTDAGVQTVVQNGDGESSNVPDTASASTSQQPAGARLGRTPRVELVQGIVILASTIIAAAFVASRVQVYEFAKPYVRSFTAYTKCVFKNYDGTASYLDDCGEHPANHPKELNVTIFIITVFSANIIIAPAYFIAYLADYLFVRKEESVVDSSRRVDVIDGVKSA